MMTFLFLSFLSCLDKPLAIDEAQNLQKNGQLKEAFLKYEEIISGDYDVLSKEKSKLQLQQIYSSYAEKLGPVDEELAIKLNNKIIERWAYSSSADLAQKRVELLLQKKEDHQKYKQQDQDDCKNAQSSNSRELWEHYAQKHPVGICIKEARIRLEQKVTTSEHRMQLESILTKCMDIQKKCIQYESRFMTIKGKGEIQYLISTFSVFLDKLIQQDQTLQEKISSQIQDLEKQNYDVLELQEVATQRCTPCSTAQQNLNDIRACNTALTKNTPQQWDVYATDFPNGACPIP